jgi:plastocyanin
MKTKNKISLIFNTLVLCIIAGIIFYSCSKSSGSNNTNTAGTTTTNTVVIKGFAFSPASLTVKKGTKVTWVNNDGPAHTVTATDNGNTFNSGTIAPGSSYSFTFTTAGDFNYNCTIHPQMVASVHVQ